MWEPWDHRAVVPPSHTMWVLPEKTHALGCSATCSWPFQRGDWDYQSDAGSCPAAVLETPIVIIAWNIVWTQELLVQCSAPNCCCPNTHRNHRVTQPHTLLTILHRLSTSFCQGDFSSTNRKTNSLSGTAHQHWIFEPCNMGVAHSRVTGME